MYNDPHNPHNASHNEEYNQRTRRKTEQRFIKKGIKLLKSQIVQSPLDSYNLYVHKHENRDLIHPPFVTTLQQLQTLVNNQKAMLDLSLNITHCISSRDSKAVQTQKHKSLVSKLLSQWEETTRDLLTHFEILHKQQEDLISLQQEDLSSLQRHLDFLNTIQPPCIPPLQQQQGRRRSSSSSLSQVFQDSPRDDKHLF